MSKRDQGMGRKCPPLTVIRRGFLFALLFSSNDMGPVTLGGGIMPRVLSGVLVGDKAASLLGLKS
jgi:hypothetical protein